MRDDDTIRRLLRQALETRAEVAGELGRAIRAMDTSREGAWKDLVQCMMAVGVGEDVLARELNCSRPTLVRWLSGQSEPHEVLRANMRGSMARMVEDVAKGAETALARLVSEDGPDAPAP